MAGENLNNEENDFIETIIIKRAIRETAKIFHQVHELEATFWDRLRRTVAEVESAARKINIEIKKKDF